MRTEGDHTAEIGGLICAGCFFIGMGIGWVLGNLRSWLFIGLGVANWAWRWSATASGTMSSGPRLRCLDGGHFTLPPASAVI